MEELIRYIVSKLVRNPQVLKVEEEREGDRATIRVQVDPDDMGRVIGRQGKIARSIRAIAKAVGTKENILVSVDFDEIRE
ncbi:Predicted RNA-binding protein (contains KH domain) [Aedoeadaptatus ivorii]|uniref:RNA-binding protein KhpA n=1 Tax=Aedoeadaptatus ivorii TaxID=54006 RepID=A0A448V1I6_9FIRM|nr:KH domain-containing protein [Peptoniphilus ivorii]MDQ0507880.1 putative RNA-binding protein YlqC (UPF0109 family) [Peptoniphilus ivorii]VEJ35706.1 Predicted RNA-binding protein (contains KH domain) [Peptoniphilus ivorii]